jgi:rhomboid family GlyGly-CTERM serine protease
MKGLKLNNYYCPIVILLICLILALAPDSIQNGLQYQQASIKAGEWWRLISAHLVHIGWAHLAMNLAGLILIWHLFITPEKTPVICIVHLPLLALGTALGLLWLNPELSWYRGLSGILHGLIVISLLYQVKNQPRFSILLLFLIAAKIAWEQLSGPTPGSEAWVSGKVIVDAHLYGGISGVILWAAELGYKRLFQHEATE